MNPLPSIRTKTITLKGGLDLETPAVAVGEGFSLEATNIEPNLMGGYRRILGYERIAGGKTPSQLAKITALYVDSISGEIVGSVVSGSISGATGVIIEVDSNLSIIGLTDVSGAFVDADVLTSATVIDVSGQHPDPVTNSEWLLEAENHFRDLIKPLPNSETAYAVQRYNGRTYALADSGLWCGTQGTVSGNTTGWELITVYRYLRLTSLTGALSSGDVVTGATAIGGVLNFVKQGGTYGVDAFGYVVVNVTAGAFIALEDVKVSAVTVASASGTDTSIDLTPPVDGGSRSKMTLNNFGATADREKMYFINGLGAFELDDNGMVVTPIFTGQVPEQPLDIQVHKNHLFASFRGGVIRHSAIADPLVWNVVLGAGELQTGEEIKSLESSGSDTLIIATARHLYGLQGSSSINWQMKILASDIADQGDTLRTLGAPTMLTNKGIVRVDSGDVFGVFESSTVSRRINPLINDWINRKILIGSRVNTQLNQYRLYFKDGSGIIMGHDELFGSESLPQFTTFQYPVGVTCVSEMPGGDGDNVDPYLAVSPEIDRGELRDYIFGGDDGYIYRESIGNSFDGKAIPYVLKLPYHHLGSPILRKSFKWVDVGIDAVRTQALSLTYEFSGGRSHTDRSEDGLFKVTKPYDALWGEAQWGEFAWGGGGITQPQVSLNGTGTDISLLFYGSSNTDEQFSVNSLTYSFLPRRLTRG